MPASLLPKTKEKATETSPSAARTPATGPAKHRSLASKKSKVSKRAGLVSFCWFFFFFFPQTPIVFLTPLPAFGCTSSSEAGSGCLQHAGLGGGMAACPVGLSPLVPSTNCPPRPKQSPSEARGHGVSGALAARPHDPGAAGPGGTAGPAQSPLVPAESVPLCASLGDRGRR